MSVRRVVMVWFALALLMSANGAFRELILRPRVGQTPADVLSAVLGAILILAATWFSFGRASVNPTHLARASALLLVLTVAFEFLFGHYVDGKTWTALFANYAVWRGRLWPVLLALLALTPFIWGRWLSPRAHHAR
jgi:hypothetical protein